MNCGVWSQQQRVGSGVWSQPQHVKEIEGLMVFFKTETDNPFFFPLYIYIYIHFETNNNRKQENLGGKMLAASRWGLYRLELELKRMVKDKWECYHKRIWLLLNVPHNGYKNLHFLRFCELSKRKKLEWILMFS
jgi:hypothetical protein